MIASTKQTVQTQDLANIFPPAIYRVAPTLAECPRKSATTVELCKLPEFMLEFYCRCGHGGCSFHMLLKGQHLCRNSLVPAFSTSPPVLLEYRNYKGKNTILFKYKTQICDQAFNLKFGDAIQATHSPNSRPMVNTLWPSDL